MDKNKSAVSPFQEHKLRDSEDSFICRKTRLLAEETALDGETQEKSDAPQKRRAQSREVLRIHKLHESAMKSAGEWRKPEAENLE